jgi:hypothetical protein
MRPMNHYLKALFLKMFMLGLTISNAFAADKPEYKISNIPANLQKNAKIVIRNRELIIDVDENDATEKYKIVISILNKNGTDYTVFKEIYDSYSSISGFEYTLYDAEGKKYKSYGSGDLIFYSGYHGYTLYDDFRNVLFDPEYKKYPCTVEYNFRRKIKSLLLLQNWEIFPDYNCSVEKSSLVINVKKGVNIKYLEKNMPATCLRKSDNDGEHYVWEVQALEAFSKEDFEEPFQEITPVVYISPVQFEIDKTSGNFNSWKEFGKWYSELIKGRDVLTPETIKKIEELTSGLDTINKIRKLYRLLQNHTRYVSIQVGIGSWQPFEAKTVDRLGYGDCKALSNYMYSMLKAIGIKSNQMIIMAGEVAPSTIFDFPSNFFNHVIIVVPCQKDTLFLECTDPYFPAGYIGAFTDSRYGLMTSDSGGVMVRTTSYRQEDNITSSHLNVNLDIEGNSQAKIKTTYKGIGFDGIKLLSVQTNEDITKNLYKRIDISNYSISSFSFTQPDSTRPEIIENIDLNLQNYAAKMGKKAFVQLDLLNRITEIPYITETRKSKIVIRRYKTIIDTIVYKIPDNYIADKGPSEFSITSEFGSYQSKCSIGNGEVVYTRKYSLKPGVFEPKDASKFKDFYTEVSKADRMMLVLVQK